MSSSVAKWNELRRVFISIETKRGRCAREPHTDEWVVPMLLVFLASFGVIAILMTVPRTPGDAWFSRRNWGKVEVERVPIHDAAMGAYRREGEISRRLDEAPLDVRRSARLASVVAVFSLVWIVIGEFELAIPWLDVWNKTANPFTLFGASVVMVAWPLVPMLLVERAASALLDRHVASERHARLGVWTAAATCVLAFTATVFARDWQAAICLDGAAVLLVVAAVRVARVSARYRHALAQRR
jgi:hypothetical protein